MGMDVVNYYNRSGDVEVDAAVMDALSGFDVDSKGVLTLDSMEMMINDHRVVGLVTHFPVNASRVNTHYNEPIDDMYAGAFDMLRTIRRNRPNLPILVYTGAGVGGGEAQMEKDILAAGANCVVFKDEAVRDAVVIKRKCLELFR